MKKIILLGYMGSGKSTIAKILSQELKVPYYDLDQIIEEKLQESIVSIFKSKGEIFFRKKEHEILKEILARDEKFILSLGGGTPCYANNHVFLISEDVVSIYLKASIETLHTRLQNNISNRPVILQNTNEPFKTFIAKQLFDRSYYYYQANNIVQVDDKTPEEVVNEIKKILT